MKTESLKSMWEGWTREQYKYGGAYNWLTHLSQQKTDSIASLVTWPAFGIGVIFYNTSTESLVTMYIVQQSLCLY